MSRVVFQARGLKRFYPMGEITIQALRGVDLELHAAELVVMLGASGSGKSTLLNILGGLDSPSEGSLLYYPSDPRDSQHSAPRHPASRHYNSNRASPAQAQGIDLARANQRELTRFRRHHVGFVFQFYNLISSLTARENVAVVTDISRHPLSPEEALALVGLEHRLDHFPSQLSGGEQQRVAIARAVAKQPDVMLCDEPTGALDFQTGIRVLEVLERINRETGTTVAIITHNEVIGDMADRIVRLRDGRVEQLQVNTQRRMPQELRW
ncbi:ABC transporter ATP-binding protein [Billgrantia tianxiuensis]|jgi:putative ABC transport system ATP-binding protein|uniref:ABC transporter ATP-binding protein n=1 Tax=Billgrantia tianxiuensis TaxID=2497861 RepID=A0A6I6SN69_9GAMM|nr:MULTISPECIES: ABC transporter ATP-binding protein [Halomonas]MCE8031931.1 ABC transporter ATP-binding protein [Halomonas sp. MCCC 1A11057]QHC49996.1 ABC transporter ATP-binding protein [Halomonas tianxiuensis]